MIKLANESWNLGLFNGFSYKVRFRNLTPTPLQLQELDDLLKEFSDIFSKSDKDFGLLVNNFHKIDTADHKPFRSRDYQKSYSEEKNLSSEISKLVTAGLIKPSKSLWYIQ